MVVLSKHACFGDALDALFARPDGDALAVRSVDGAWCVVRDREALAAFEREQARAAIPYGTDFTW